MSLSSALKELLIKHPFYGIFLLSLNKEIVDNNHPVKTAAVGPNGLGFTLYINKDYWDSHSNKFQEQLLVHECRHLCFFHLTSLYKAENMHNMNIATDTFLNNDLDELKEEGWYHEKLEEAIGEKLEKGCGSWKYYKAIEKFTKEHPEKCLPTYSDHSLWPKDLSEAEQVLYENQIKTNLKNTADIINKCAGSIPGELKEILDMILTKKPIYNWKKHFRNIITNSITSEIQLTRMRPSKRFDNAMGIKVKRKPSILVAVDTSGSITKNELKEFFSEIDHINKSNINVDVIEFDTKVQNYFKYKRHQDIKISGRGGTCANCVFEYYKENLRLYSSLVIFTDGYLSSFELPNMRNVVWVITKSGNKSQKYTGKTIFIP